VLDGSMVIIEIQVLNHPGLEKRILYNAAKNYSVQLKSGEDYTLLNPVIALTLVDFTLFADSQSHISRFQLIEKNRFIEYSDDIELVLVELPKFNKQEEALEGIHDKWLYFINNAGTLDFVPKDIDAELVKAFAIINEANMSAEELEAQYKRKEFIYIQKSSVEQAQARGQEQGLKLGIEQGLKQGIAQGIDRGKLEKQQELVRKAQQAGLSLPLISEITGLAPEEIQAILAQQ